MVQRDGVVGRVRALFHAPDGIAAHVPHLHRRQWRITGDDDIVIHVASNRRHVFGERKRAILERSRQGRD
jgi:hypothetical protein